jgi:hypothetical protein
MADMTRFDLDKVNVIGKLGTTPQERGLTTQQFKDKFDEGPIALGEFVNETLIPEVEAHLADYSTNAIKKDGSVTMENHLSFQPSFGMRVINEDTLSAFDIINFVGVSTANVVARMFRSTNTTGSKSFIIHTGNGSASIAFQIVDGEINRLNGAVVTITAGSGSPEGVKTATVGSIYLRTNGGSSTTLYVKESGTGNTGWKAVQTA